MPTTYEIPDLELVRRFEDTCRRSDSSRSGEAVPPTPSHDLIERHHLRGILLARLHRLTPPFHPEQCLRLKPEVRSSGGSKIREIVAGEIFVVSRVFYDGIQWTVAFKGHEKFDYRGAVGDRYRAEEFELAPR